MLAFVWTHWLTWLVLIVAGVVLWLCFRDREYHAYSFADPARAWQVAAWLHHERDAVKWHPESPRIVWSTMGGREFGKAALAAATFTPPCGWQDAPPVEY